MVHVKVHVEVHAMDAMAAALCHMVHVEGITRFPTCSFGPSGLGCMSSQRSTSADPTQHQIG